MSSKESKSHQLPSSMVDQRFGEINVNERSDATYVTFTILTTPDLEKAGGYQTGVAIDASKSMKELFGKSLKGTPPDELVAEWKAKGWIYNKTVDGKLRPFLATEAKAEAIKRGFFKKCENVIQPIAREFTAYLADGLDEDAGTTVIYWACGPGGNEIEVLGDYSGAECSDLKLEGPIAGFGEGTFLLPAVNYFVDRFSDAENGIYLFVTDGRINDFEALCKRTFELSSEIAAGDRHPVKLVLIGLGDDICLEQFEGLDDLETAVDIWDYKLAHELRDLSEIFSEVVDENEILFPPSDIYDDQGRLVLKLSQGVPARVSFRVRKGCQFFELRCQGEVIRQPIVIDG